MSERIPPLRGTLDGFPSPAADYPGILLRDPMGFAEGVLLVPPLLATGLVYFDGTHTEDELISHYLRTTGDARAGEAGRAFLEHLREYGFLQSPEFEARRAGRQRAFVEALVRRPAHAGTGYPEDPEALREQLARYMESDSASASASASASGSDGDEAVPALLGIAAPHVSPQGGFRSYAAAFSRLGPEDADRTFVLLGTSHYGAPERFGVTKKPFETPAGMLPVAEELVDLLVREGGSAVEVEDYCHSVEHSLEFQCVFLRHVLGRSPRIVPILCGPFVRALREGHQPEEDEGVLRFFDALRSLARREERVTWILGVDLAHIGRRYGDTLAASADEGAMAEVREADLERLSLLLNGDADAFWDLVAPGQDRLRWCGLAPLYTFARVLPEARGRLLRYEQWNIDDQSVVSFAGIEYR